MAGMPSGGMFKMDSRGENWGRVSLNQMGRRPTISISKLSSDNYLRRDFENIN